VVSIEDTIASRSSAPVAQRCRSRTFFLEQREEGLHRGVVTPGADPAHRPTQFVGLEEPGRTFLDRNLVLTRNDRGGSGLVGDEPIAVHGVVAMDVAGRIDHVCVIPILLWDPRKHWAAGAKLWLPVLIGSRADGRKELFALADGYRESADLILIHSS